MAADVPFTAAFSGTGRACSGGFFVRARTIEWNATYSVCKPQRYTVLEDALDREPKRIVYRIEGHGRQCPYRVVEVEQATAHGWNVSGYRSPEAYRNRDQPAWRNSPLPERFVLSCLMTRLE
jgi:carbohydrate-binding DOMON domain-containing protein